MSAAVVVTLTPDHPVVRAAAAAMTDELSSVNRDIWPFVADEFAYMLCDFTRPATRDYWVRWLSTPKNHPDRLMWGLAEKYRERPEALSRAVVDALETK